MRSLTLPVGRKLAYREAGSGAPLVLVHGSPGDGRFWSRVADRLAAHRRLLMPDLPGYGGSDPLPDDALGQTAAMGEAVGALIESCGEPVGLCGHSYGGNVALHAAMTHAQSVRGVVLLEPVFFRALHLARDEAVLPSAERFFSAYADRVTGGEPAAVSDMFDYWFGPGAFARLPAPVQGSLSRAAPNNGTAVRASLAEQVTVEQLAAFAAPVLVAYGGASPTVAPAIARALVRLLPRARLHAVPGAGHGMPDSHPDAVADLILAVTSAPPSG